MTKSFMKKIILQLTGMNCASCSVLIDTVLEELPGVSTSKTSYATQQVEVEYNESLVKPDQMIAVIKSEGYEANIN
jgi:copper chaperone CopZ